MKTNNNVIDISDKLHEMKCFRKLQAAVQTDTLDDITDEEFEYLVLEGYLDIEYLEDTVPTELFMGHTPVNDNSLFEELLDEYIPETIEEYERLFGDTFGDPDYEPSWWYNQDEDTGEFIYD